MSWNIHIHVQIPPRESGYDMFVQALQKEAQAAKDMPIYGSPSFGTVQRRIVQINNAVKAAIELFRFTVIPIFMDTEFPRGCNVFLWLDGHVEEETLNYRPSHVGMRIAVNPVPLHK